MIRKVLLGLLAILILIQFIPKNQEVHESSEKEIEFYTANQVPQDIQNIMDAACMDCHSYRTTYPWYANIAPFSFFVEDHVEEGREHLNFHDWNSYSAKKADHKLEECVEEIEEGEMPMKPYVLMHSEADLAGPNKERLMAYFASLRK
jgi:hypothetical protein